MTKIYSCKFELFGMSFWLICVLAPKDQYSQVCDRGERAVPPIHSFVAQARLTEEAS